MFGKEEALKAFKQL